MIVLVIGAVVGLVFVVAAVWMTVRRGPTNAPDSQNVDFIPGNGRHGGV